MYDKKEVLIKFINNEITGIPMSLNENIGVGNVKFTPRLELKALLKHVDDFLDGNKLNRYFILPGLRGVGKSTILFQVYDYLLNKKRIPQNQILYLSCENLNRRFEFKIVDVIECFLKYHHNATLRTLDKNIFLFIDESQYDADWAVSGKIIFDSNNKIFMIFTGSSALNLEFNADSARRLLKRNINPLTYNQYLKLKYNFNSDELSNSLFELLFTGNVENSINNEKKIIPQLYNIPGFRDDDLDYFIEYGGFPFSFLEKDVNIINERLVSTINKVISKDIPRIGNNSPGNIDYAYRLINFLALQKPGEISQNNISNYLDCSSTKIKHLLNTLEKTHLIFHCEPYGSGSKRYRKSWRYFFATSSLRNVLNNDLDNPIQNMKAYKGILLENFVASILYHLKSHSFKLFYDSTTKNKNVDFLIQKGENRPIPLEVGVGKKDKRHILTSIKKYKSDYGIIVSNNTSFIKKDKNIIYLPPKTFSFL